MVEEAPAGWGVFYDVVARFYRLRSRFRSKMTYGFGSGLCRATKEASDGGGWGMKRGPICPGRGDGGS